LSLSGDRRDACASGRAPKPGPPEPSTPDGGIHADPSGSAERPTMMCWTREGNARKAARAARGVAFGTYEIARLR